MVTVVVRYEGGRPVAVETIVISTQHAPEIEDMSVIEADMREHVISPVMEAAGIPWEGATLYVNPTGRFVVGGPMGDTGLTGRRIIVDTYGGMPRPARRRGGDGAAAAGADGVGGIPDELARALAAAVPVPPGDFHVIGGLTQPDSI